MSRWTCRTKASGFCTLRLMRRGAGLPSGAGDPETVGDSLDHVIGRWSDAEAEAFRESLRTLDTTDESLWS